MVFKTHSSSGCIHRLYTRETPKQILSEDFPDHEWPVSGGWGYTQKDAVVIELDDSVEGVSFEYKFLEYRCYEEGIIYRPRGEKLAGFSFRRDSQSLVCEGDRKYDRINMIVSAYKQEHFVLLKDDWDEHNGYEGDPEGRARHLAMARKWEINCTVSAWFDVTRFFGK